MPVTMPPTVMLEPPKPANPIPGAGEIFSGENFLEARLSKVPLSEKLLAVDPTYNTELPHSNSVVKVMTDIGIPAENISGTGVEGLFCGDVTDRPHTYWHNHFDFNAAYPVVVQPIPDPWATPGAADAVRRNNTLFVTNAGNASQRFDRRDLYTRSLPGWAEESKHNWGVPNHDVYKEIPNTMKTSKAVIAKWAGVDARGNIVPDLVSVQCGDAKFACFSVMLPSGKPTGPARPMPRRWLTPRCTMCASWRMMPLKWSASSDNAPLTSEHREWTRSSALAL